MRSVGLVLAVYSLCCWVLATGIWCFLILVCIAPGWFGDAAGGFVVIAGFVVCLGRWFVCVCCVCVDWFGFVSAV